MDYHKDRFEDFSLMVFKKNKLLAVLPLNKKEMEVYSHAGLTYGGLLLKKEAKLKEVLFCYQHILKYLSEEGIQTLHIKQIPGLGEQRDEGLAAAAPQSPLPAGNMVY